MFFVTDENIKNKEKNMLNFFEEISKYISQDTGINKEYIHLTILTILAFLFFDILKFLIRKMYSKLPVSDKKKYFRNRKIKITLTVICWLVVILIWKEQIKSLMTLISFVSAAVTIALREIIFNFFAGIYINAKKILEVEDRIEIKGPKTCGELIDHLKKTYDVNVDMLTADGETIITTFFESAKEKMGLKIEEAYAKNTKKTIRRN